MVENFLAGGAAVSVLARQHGIGLTVVDCGVRHEFAPRPGLVVCKQGPGTADALDGPAMSAEQQAGSQPVIEHGELGHDALGAFQGRRGDWIDEDQRRDRPGMGSHEVGGDD